MNQKNCNNGYIALISVLVISAVGVAAAISLILLGLGSSRTSFTFEQSNQAKALANTCAEEALNRLRLDINYSGNETINLGQGACFINSIIINGSQRTIQVEGTVAAVVRRLRILAQVQPSMQIISWQELAEF